jgi:cob(I)alamin adenosyltransferase
MSSDDYQTKPTVVVVYTGEGKGKTTAALGLMVRALGAGWQVAVVQFIKKWPVSEHKFFEQIMPVYKKQLFVYQGGQGFYNAGKMSAKNVTKTEHKKSAQQAYKTALTAVSSGQYNLVICDEINNAVHDGLLTIKQLAEIIKNRSPKTSLCLTGRNFPVELLPQADIATDMHKLKHHFDDKFLANIGIDY